MEQNTARLQSLLSKERLIRSDVIHNSEKPVFGVRLADISTSSNDDIDSPLISSPENIQLTRNRLSRLRNVNDGGNINHSHFKSQMNSGKHIRNVTDDDKVDVASIVNNITPRKKSRSLKLPAEPFHHQDTTTRQVPTANMRQSVGSGKGKSHSVKTGISAVELRRMRNSEMDDLTASHYIRDELPGALDEKRPRSERSSIYVTRPIPSDYSDESVFGMDLDTCLQAEQQVAAGVRSMSTARDHCELVMEARRAVEGLHPLGMICAQLWLIDLTSDALWTMDSDGRTVVLARGQFDHMMSRSGGREGGTFTLAAQTIKPVVGGDGDIADFNGNSHFSFIESTMLSAGAPRQRSDVADGRWAAIHLMPLVGNRSDEEYSPHLSDRMLGGQSVGFIGVLVAAEALPVAIHSLPFHMSSAGQRQIQAARLRSLIVVQVLQRVAIVAANRVEYLRLMAEQHDAASLHQSSSAIGASRQTLLSCSLKLLQTPAAQLSVVQIALDVVNAGVVDEHVSQIPCWLLLSEAVDEGSSPTRRDSQVCVVASSAASQRPERLWADENGNADCMRMRPRTRLLGELTKDAWGDDLAVVSGVSPVEMEAAGMFVLAERDSELTLMHLTTSFISEEEEVVCSGGSVGPGCLGCTLVLVVPPEADRDLLASHAKNLLRIASEAFTRLLSARQKEQLTRLDCIPTELYRSVASCREGPGKALSSLLTAIASERVAGLFGVRRSALVVAGELGSSIEARAPQTGFSVLDRNSQLNSVAGLPLNVRTEGWMRDLNGGKIVFYRCSHLTPVRGTRRDQGNKRSSDRSAAFVSHSDDEEEEEYGARSSLRALVRAVEPTAQYAMLVPVQTVAGLCVLVLVDRVDFSSGRASSGGSFSAPYVKSLIASQLCGDITSCLCALHDEAVQHALKAELAQQLLASQQQAEQTANLLAKQVELLRAQLSFGRWRLVAQKQRAEATEGQAAAMLASLMSLVTHRAEEKGVGGEEDEDQSDRFMAVVAMQMGALFPSDSVHLEAIGSSIEADTPTRCCLRGEVVDSWSSPSLLAGNDRPSRKSVSSTVLGRVRVTRASQRTSAFSTTEAIRVKIFCSMAGQIYSSLHRGLSRDFARGDVRSLLLPMLAQLLPVLLPARSEPSHVRQALRARLPLLLDWVKRMCDAELVVLRMGSSSSSSSIECLMSSDEADPRTLLSDLPRLQDTLHREEILSSASVPAGHLKIVLSDEARTDRSIPVELKVVASRGRRFSEEQSAVAELLAYLVAYSTATADTSLTSVDREVASKSAIARLEGEVAALQRDILTEQHAAAKVKSRFTHVLSFLMLISRLPGAATRSALSVMLNESLSPLVGASSAVLLVSDRQLSASAGSNGPFLSDDFRVVLPTGDGGGSPTLITRQQVSQLPSFFRDPAATQSKIVLAVGADNSPPFGAVLLFRSLSPSNEAGGVEDSWRGMEDLLVESLGSIVYECLSRLNVAEHVTELKRLLSGTEHAQASISALQTDLSVALDIKASLEQQRAQLQSEVVRLKQTVEEQLVDRSVLLRGVEEEVSVLGAKREAMADRLSERIRTLEQELVVDRDALGHAKTTKSQLMDLLSTFAFDRRCQQETVVQWLSDVAEGQEASLLTMSQAAVDGTLSGGDGIRGVLAAAGEAIRTGSVVELTTTYSTVSSDGVQRTVAKSNQGGKLTQSQEFTNSSSARAHQINILCVPNRCVTSQLGVATDHACFVFVRGSGTTAGAGIFSADSKDLLSCAVNLACRVLAKAVVKFCAEDFRQAEVSVEAERHSVQQLRRAVVLGEKIRLREFRSRLEVGRAIEQGVVELLSRGPLDACQVGCSVLFPPWNSLLSDGLSNVLLLSGMHSDVVAVQQVLASGRSQGDGGVLWTPLLGHRGVVVAVLKTERRPRSNGTREDGNQAGRGISLVETCSAPLEDVLFSALDEEVLGVFMSLSLPLLDRADFIAEALDGVKHAGQAILALQQVRTNMEDRFAVEVAKRLQLQEALKAGADMLGCTSSQRVNVGQLLDAARKAILSVTSSLDCFVILPRVVWRTLQMGGAAMAEGGGDDEYLTLVADRVDAVHVRLENGDLEQGALHAFKVAITGMDGGADAKHWQSWAVRRAQGDATFGAVAGSLRADLSTDLFSIAVPFALRSGARAVVSSTRRSAAYSDADAECISWISRVLAYCLQMHGGSETAHELEMTVKQLRGEVDRLGAVEQQIGAVERGLEVLEKDLFAAEFASGVDGQAIDTSSDTDGMTLVAATTKAAFGGASLVETWSAEEAVQSFGVILPSESFLREGRSSAVLKDTLVLESGKLSYWLDADGALCEGLDFFQQHDDKRDTGSRQSSRQGKSESTSKSVLYAICQLRGLPVVWLKISTHLTPSQCRLRLVLLMKLLECQHVWRHKYLVLFDNHCLQVSAASDARKQLTVELEQQRVAHEQAMDGLREKSRAVLDSKAKSHRTTEDVLLTALVGGATVFGDLNSLQGAATEDICNWAEAQVVRLAKQMEVINDVRVTVSAHSSAASNLPFPGDSVQMSASSGAVVVCLAGGASEETVTLRDQLTAMASRLGGASLDKLMFVSPSHTLTANSFVLPITLDAVGSRLSVMVQCIGHKIESSTTRKLLQCCLTGWLSLQQVIQHVASGSVIVNKLQEQLQITKFIALKRTLIHARLTRTSLAMAFTRLRNAALTFKLDGVSSLVQSLSPRLNSATAQLRRLEQLSADWTELVKGVNGACSAGITNGVAGLWAQSCSTLVSVVSSQLALTGCGLLVLRDGELVEFSVREVSTPLAPFRGGDREIDDEQSAVNRLAEYAQGVLERRPASDLGQRVHQLAADIISGTAGSQRMFKLARPKQLQRNNAQAFGDHREDGENLWLVPIRTARSVLGILRVSVEVPSATQMMGSSMRSTSARSRSVSFGEDLNVSGELGEGGDERVEYFSVDELVQAAQSNLINFAEVMAPVFAATLQIDRSRLAKNALEDASQQQSREMRSVSEQHRESNRVLSLTSLALGVLAKVVASADWSAKDTSATGCHAVLCDHSVVALSEVLGGRVSVELVGTPSAGGPSGDADRLSVSFLGERPYKSTRKKIAGDTSAALLGGGGEILGTISFRVGGDSSTAVQEGIHQLRGGQQPSPSSSGGMAVVIKAAAHLLSGALVSCARAFAAKERQLSIERELRETEGALEAEKEEVVVSLAATADLGRLMDFYRGLADVVNQCLIFTVAPQSGENTALTTNPQLLDLLRTLTGRLPALIGNGCLFSFAVLDSTPSSSSSSSSEGRLLQWVYGEGAGPEEQPANPFSATAADFVRVNEGVKELSANLVHSCVTKKTRSSFDVGVNSPSTLNLSTSAIGVVPSTAFSATFRLQLSNVRILTFPLLDAESPHEALGAMQVLLDLSSGRQDVEALCGDIAAAVACAMSQAAQRQRGLARAVQLELQTIALDVKGAEERRQVATWQQRSLAWKGVAQLATELVSKGCSSTEKFVGVLQSSAVAKVLLDSGVEVAVRKRSKSSTRLSSSGVLSSALVPVTLGAEEVVLEVTCVDTRQTSGDHIDGLSSVASELVDVISNVMRSILAVNRLHQSDAVQAEKFSASAAHKVDKLQNHLKVARLELEDTVSKRKAIAADLMRQTERYEALRSQASSAVTSLCVPAIAEVAAMLEDVSVHQQSAGGDVGEVSEWAWNGLAKVTGRAVERISDGRFPHHVSVLVTSNLDNVNEGLSLRMYDGGALIAESFSAARASSGEAASALERAMRLGRGVLECSGDVVAPSDLLGVGHRLLGTLFGVTPTSRSGLSVLLITVPNARMGTSAVVRLIYCAADEGRQSSESKGEDLSGDEENFPASLLRPMLEMLTNLGASLIQSSAQHGARLREVDLVRIDKDAETERADHAGVLLSRTRKMYRVVCREASVLLDAPIVGPGGVTPRATHPANLTPLAASQDCCLKLLGLVRTLLRSEGQALLLRDSGTEPTTYQVIHTGDSMHWPGVEQGTFGVVSAPSLSTVHLTTSRGERRSGSLAEAAMSSKRSVYTSDAANDSRYCSYLDGVCAVGTPSLTVPLRGRGGAVVGALIIARSKGATPFTPDDVAAAEMVAAFGSLSLYWCHGLGSLHHQLNRNVNKMEHLERAVQRLSIKQ